MRSKNRTTRRQSVAYDLMRLAVLFSINLFVACCAEAAPPDTTELFESKIRPLLVEHCQKCHGDKKQFAGLRLDSGDALLTGGDTGPAVVAGKPDESELLKRVTDPDDELRMPPTEAGPRLNHDQIAVLRQWIELGAVWPAGSSHDKDAKQRLWREHWAFQPVKRPVVPAVEGGASRVKNLIDQFVLQKLDASKLQMSPEADRRTLIRRATYDLLGLPPTSDEVTAFINDTAPAAYERLIDRLLASPRYGEQWGRYWLDVARYSDTKGYVYGREERNFIHSSLYRDWVIRAFNDDLPYNRFLLLQLAADQVAPDDASSFSAMGYLTLGRRFLGVTPDIIDDRIDVVGRGLLGLTVGCARCHDHKYDPIPTADYYSLYGVFQNCVERQVPIPRQPDATAPTADFEKGLQERLQKLRDTTAIRRAEANERVRTRLKDYLLSQRNLDKYPELAFNQLTPKEELIPGIVRRWQAFLGVAEKNGDPIFAPWIAYNRLSDDEFSSRAAEITEQLQANRAKLNPRIAEAFAQPANSAAEVADRYVQVLAKIDEQWKAIGEVANRDNQPAPQALPDASDEALRQVLYGENSPCVIPDESIVDTEPYWDYATIVELWGLQSEFDRWLLQNPISAPYTVVLNDRRAAIEPQIFKRGNPANKGEVVPPQFLEVIAGPERKPFVKGSGRLEMAQAVVDSANPLTVRVWVNRVWAHHFGAGLVTTPSDFGVRAARPSHPELLDWLASEFVTQNWSTKALHRQIMLSATYRQAAQGPVDSTVLARAQMQDPENRLLWHMNPRRLSFEQFHDSLAALSGELDLTIGGKGSGMLGLRRSVYTLVDRQFLPTTMSVFDFANPDLHSPQRAESTIPQQALFALNNPYVVGRAQRIAARVGADTSDKVPDRIARLYQAVLERDPSPTELQFARQYLADDELARTNPSTSAKAWSYGYGELDELSGRLKTFQPLPHLIGSAWQGGPVWPDATLGWVQLTALGGHTGNDHRHAAVRRWTASLPGTVAIKSAMAHQFADGDGVRCWIVSSRQGILKSATVHNRQEPLDIESLVVEPGDTIDFVVDVAGVLHNDQFVWQPSIIQTISGPIPANAVTAWNAGQDFPRTPATTLSAFEQLTQLLLISNEVMFVD